MASRAVIYDDNGCAACFAWPIQGTCCEKDAGGWMRILSKYLLFAICLLFSVPCLAQNSAGMLKGDVRLNGERPSKTPPAIVEYHGPCGTKRSTEVVRLWKKRM